MKQSKMETKTCKLCTLEKELLLFVKQAKSKDGHSSWCKECANAYNRLYKSTPEQKQKDKERFNAYKEKNKEKILAKNKEYRDINNVLLAEKRKLKRIHNLEDIRKKERLVYSENKIAINERKRKVRNENKELYNETNKKWYAENKERIRNVSNDYRRKNKEFYSQRQAQKRLLNPEYYKRSDKKRIENITDGYVKNIIFGRMPVEFREIATKEMIELKRLSIELKRIIKNKKP